MSKHDVVLINIPSTKGNKKIIREIVTMPPLGQMYIASHLIKEGFTVDMMDMCVSSITQEAFIDYLKDRDPAVIGISSFYESWSALKVLCKVIKDNFPSIVLCVGGHCSTISYNQLLDEMSIDYVILGEGEYALGQLCHSVINKNVNIDNINGIAYYSNDTVKVSQPDRICNLNDLVFPNRDLLPLDKYVYPITISTARGCTGNCMFCSSKAFWHNKVVFREPENILEEVLYIKNKYNYNEFFIVDDTFTMIPDRAIKFCELLKKTSEKFYWFCESRADVIDEKLLRILWDSGCVKIQFGMESGNDEILKKIGKNVTTAQIENAVRLATEIGMDTNVSFIIGHAFDTYETMQQSIDFAIRLRKLYGANVLCSINTPYPGTRLYHDHDKLGVTIHTTNWDLYTMNNAVISTNNFSSQDLRNIFHEFYARLSLV